jgi:hypothetical protein
MADGSFGTPKDINSINGYNPWNTLWNHSPALTFLQDQPGCPSFGTWLQKTPRVILSGQTWDACFRRLINIAPSTFQPKNEVGGYLR